MHTARIGPVDAGDAHPVPHEDGLFDLFQQRTDDAEQLGGRGWVAPRGRRGGAVAVDQGIDTHSHIVCLGGDDLPEDVDAGRGGAWWVAIVLVGGDA